jgi:predicted Zn-dependent protease
MIQGRTFIHPDMNFFLEFPEKWQIENSPQKLVAVAPDGNAAVMLSAVAEGDDPLDGARAVEKSTKVSVVDKTQRTTVNGLPAAHTHMDADGKIGVDLTWIAHAGLVYQVTGLAPKNKFDSSRPVFTVVAQSFRPLSAEERAGVKEKRIRLIKANARETIEALAARSNSAWTKEEIAVANALSVQDVLQEGRLVKVAIGEPYVSKTSR